MDDTLRRAALAVSAVEGGAVFDRLAAELADILGVAIAFVAVYADPARTHMRMLAFRLDGAPRPLVGIVSRLTHQKGLDLLFDALPPLLAADELRFVALGSGEAKYVEFLRWLVRAFPGRAAFAETYSDPLAHRIEAGADVFLMPSRYEPCGLNQMYSQRYGTVPVVRRTGGLADTVEPYDPQRDTGTGFVFEHFTPQGLSWALRWALHVWRSDPEAWARLRQTRADAAGGVAMPRTVNFITGPSRSADIEQQLQMGAHGPRRLHIVLVDDNGA